MLAKVINQQKRYTSAESVIDYIAEPDHERAQELSAGLSGDAADLIEYAAREGVSEGCALNFGKGITDPMRDKRAIIKTLDNIVKQVREGGVDAEHPLYHVTVNWPPGEKPSVKQAEQTAKHTLKSLGMGEAAVTWVIHRDKEHHHIHIVACKYHPEHLNYLGPPKGDFLVLDKAMREIELEQGWTHSPGPYAVRDGRIVKLKPGERERMQRGAGAEASVEKAHGLPGIAAYCENSGVTARLRAAPSWEALHAELDSAGLRLVQKRSGFTVASVGLHGGQAVKASALHRDLSGPALEQRLGSFSPPPPGSAGQKLDGLNRWQRQAAQGIEPAAQEQPGRTGRRDQQRRAEQRQAREEARKGLLERYAEHCTQAPALKRAALAALKAEQQRERQELFAQMRGNKAGKAHGDHIDKLLREGKDAQALAGLKDAHSAQRKSIQAQHSTGWVAFLEMRARLHGDEAAIAALRGIKYREGRKKNKDKPGIEGEDVALSHAASGGGIGGDEAAFSLANAQIEVSRDKTCVLYKDTSGHERLRDTGQRIDLTRADDDEAMRAALGMADKRFGGEVFITGDSAFREKAARECARRGIAVMNIELMREWSAERELMNKERDNKAQEVTR